MQFHTIKRKTANKKKVSVGRGGTRGKTSGRGTKGQKARSGRKIRPEIRDAIKRLPKLRGRGKNSNLSIQTKPLTLPIDKIINAFDAGSIVTIASLIENKVISIYKGRNPKVKIVGGKDKDLKMKKITISGIAVSATVKEAIVKAGGMVS